MVIATLTVMTTQMRAFAAPAISHCALRKFVLPSKTANAFLRRKGSRKRHFAPNYDRPRAYLGKGTSKARCSLPGLPVGAWLSLYSFVCMSSCFALCPVYQWARG